MPFAVELLFDEKLESAVRDIWVALDEAGVSGALGSPSSPHVSLVGGETSDVSGLSTLTHEWTSGAKSIEITLSHLGRFPATEVAFLGVTPSSSLLEMHEDFHRKVMIPPAHESWDYYRPGVWVPHCTVAQPTPDPEFAKVIKIVTGDRLPIAGNLEGVRVVHWEPRKKFGPWGFAKA